MRDGLTRIQSDVLTRSSSVAQEAWHLRGMWSGRRRAGQDTLCGMCGKKRGTRQEPLEIHKRRGATKKRARREQRESMGLCVVCGKRKAIKGKKHCLECLLKARRANRAQYDAKRVKTNFSEGLCCKCNDPVVPGKKVCARHYDIARRSMEAARKNLSSTKHPWKKDNRWIFKKKTSSQQRLPMEVKHDKRRVQNASQEDARQ